MPDLRDAMMEAEQAQAARDAAALQGSRFMAGSRFQAPMPPGVTPTPEGIAAAAADPFGVPSYLVGKVSPETRDAWRDLYEGNISNQVFGGMAPVPFMGAIGGATRAAVQPIINVVKSAPKLIGGATAASVPLLASTEASEGTKEFKELDKYSDEVTALNNRIAENQGRLDKLSDKLPPEPRMTRGMSSRAFTTAQQARETAIKSNADVMAGLTKSIDKDQARLAEIGQFREGIRKETEAARIRELPLVEQNPSLRALPAVGGVLAAAAAYNPRLRAVMMQRDFTRQAGEMLPRAEAAAAGKLTTGKYPGQMRPEDLAVIESARSMGKRAPGFEGVGNPDLAAAARATPAGMLAATEGALLPYQIDYANARPGTPAREAAENRFFTGPGWMQTGLQSLIGATLASQGGALPTYRRPAPELPGYTARLEGAVNAADKRLAEAMMGREAATAAAAPRAVTPSPAGPGLTREAVEAKQPLLRQAGSTAPVTREELAGRQKLVEQARVTPADLAASEKRMNEARSRMDEAFKAAGTAEMTPSRMELLEKAKNAKSAKEMRAIFNQLFEATK